MEVLLSMIFGLLVGFGIGKIAGYSEVLVALKLHDSDVKVAKLTREKERVEKKIDRLQKRRKNIKLDTTP